MPNTRLRSSAHESLHRRIGRGHSNWTSELCGAGGSRGSEHPACPVVGASPQSRRRSWPRGRLFRGRATARSGHSPPAGCGAGSAPALPAPRNVIFGMAGFPWALSAVALRVSRPLGLTLSILPPRILGLLKATCRLRRLASLPKSVH